MNRKTLSLLNHVIQRGQRDLKSKLDAETSRNYLPVCEFDGQYEQRAQHDGPTEESRPPCHQYHDVAERLSHPAQHYSQSSAFRPIYTPRSKFDSHICTAEAWKGLFWQETGLNWIGHGCCWYTDDSNRLHQPFFPTYTFHFRINDRREQPPTAGTVSERGVKLKSFNVSVDG